MKLAVFKNCRKKGLKVIAIFFISLSYKTLATSIDSSRDCTTHFHGNVEAVNDSSAPFSIKNQKTKVTFNVIEVFRSQEEIKDQYSIQIIKGGPLKFKVGQNVEVFAESGHLCRVKF